MKIGDMLGKIPVLLHDNTDYVRKLILNIQWGVIKVILYQIRYGLAIEDIFTSCKMTVIFHGSFIKLTK